MSKEIIKIKTEIEQIQIRQNKDFSFSKILKDNQLIDSSYIEKKRLISDVKRNQDEEGKKQELVINQEDILLEEIEIENQFSDELIGQTLRRYKIIKWIGICSLGNVYEAEDTLDENKPYAIKILNKEDILNNKDLKDAYNKEIKIMEVCKCNNFVKLYDSFYIDEYFYIVIEICDGDLDGWVNQYEGDIPEDILKQILIHLNVAFDIMNWKNIVHRDLKLKNIMIKFNKEKNGSVLKFTPKLNVFNDDDITKTKLGTPETRAPEVLLVSDYSKTCDLWSLGIIIYQILFKRHPFSKNEGEMLDRYKFTSGDLKIPDERRISEHLEDLLRIMLIVDQEKRIKWRNYFKHPFFA